MTRYSARSVSQTGLSGPQVSGRPPASQQRPRRRSRRARDAQVAAGVAAKPDRNNRRSSKFENLKLRERHNKKGLDCSVFDSKLDRTTNRPPNVPQRYANQALHARYALHACIFSQSGLVSIENKGAVSQIPKLKVASSSLVARSISSQ